MSNIHIKVNKFEFPNDFSFVEKKLKLCVHITPGNYTIHSRLTGNPLKCDKINTFPIKPTNKSKVVLRLKESHFFTQDLEVGYLSIPLSWFPKDKRVNAWLPMKIVNKKNEFIMVDLEAHYNGQNKVPFSVPEGQLLVSSNSNQSRNEQSSLRHDNNSQNLSTSTPLENENQLSESPVFSQGFENINNNGSLQHNPYENYYFQDFNENYSHIPPGYCLDIKMPSNSCQEYNYVCHDPYIF